MSNHKTSIIAMSWEDLAKQAAKESDRIQGATNSYALIRLFGQEEDSVKVTLYRDHHAWCPYCQKSLAMARMEEDSLSSQESNNEMLRKERKVVPQQSPLWPASRIRA